MNDAAAVLELALIPGQGLKIKGTGNPALWLLMLERAKSGVLDQLQQSVDQPAGIVAAPANLRLPNPNR